MTKLGMASCLAVLLMWATPREVRAQESRTHVRIRVEAGRGGVALGQVRDTFAELLGAYRSAGVSLPDQRSFPAGPQFGGGVLVSVTNALYAGLTLQTTHTSAVSLYGDFAGTVDVRARTSAMFLNLAAEVDVPISKWLVPFAGMEGGPMFVHSRFEQDVALAYGDLQPPVSSSYELEVDGKKGYNILSFVGVRWYIGSIGVAGRFGYRKAVASEANAVERINGEVGAEGRAELEQDLSGIVATLGLVLDL